MEFNPKRAFEHARSISFPRETGSEGEEKTADYIRGRLRDLGLEVIEEEFLLILSPWLLLKIGLIIGLITLLSARLLVNHYPTIASLIIFGLMIALFFTGHIWQWFVMRGFSYHMNKGRRSKNIVARFPPPPFGKGGSRGIYTLYLIAHYDSKSQSLSLGIRILFISAILLCCFILGLNYLLFALCSPHVTLKDGIFLFVVLSAVILFFNKSNNLSPGGLDNAGSVGLLIGLAETLSSKRPRDLNIVFIFTGAEEEGLMGAYAFLKAHRDEIDPEKSFILNFDGIGIKGRLRIFSRKKGIPKALNKIPSWPTFPGLMMDHLPFMAQGLKAVTLGSVSVREALKIHTERDTIDIISPEGIEEVATLALDVIGELG